MNIGDTIKFLNIWGTEKSNRFGVENYYFDSNGIPETLIIHGSTQLKENKGTVVAIYKEEYIIVNFENPRKTFTQLGFRKQDLEIIKKNEFTFKISYSYSNEIKTEEIKAATKEEAISKIKYDSINYIMEYE